MKIFDKKLSVLFLFFAMGCHGGGNNGPATVADLRCQKPFGDSVKETSYADMIDGKPGTYKLFASTMYVESRPANKDNASVLLASSNFQTENYTAASEDLDPNAPTAGTYITADQSPSCADLTSINDQTLDRNSTIPSEISRVDGKVTAAIQFSLHADKDNGIISNTSPTDPEFPSLQSMIDAKASANHTKKIRFVRVSEKEVQVFFEDKFTTQKNNKGIVIVEGIYRL